MLLLGLDIGTSSIKATVIDAATGGIKASVQYPDGENDIISLQPGWAEQDPAIWWEHVKKAIIKAHNAGVYNTQDIAAIGISYQMHGLVLLDKNGTLLRNSIIWCDSRAVQIGDNAFDAIGAERCLSHLLNSPGNFTASKLAWVKEHEPEVYEQIDKIMLPGDYIAYKLTDEISTSIAALSEGVFWDFEQDVISKDVMAHYHFEKEIIPPAKDVFSVHGYLSKAMASELYLKEGIPVSYKAGDQPNNALSLNVLNPGEVAATAGTSGVIYGVTDSLAYDSLSRINSFAHVNYLPQQKRIGVLLCINGTGILNRWVKNTTGASGYKEMNEAASHIPVGSDGLLIFPFGNGAERMLENKMIGASIENLNLNIHSNAHLYRACQEGIACAFRYGLDIMRQNNVQPTIIRAGRANMFLSDVFIESFVNITRTPVELYEADGSVGAALGAGIGCGIYADAGEAFKKHTPIKTILPTANASTYEELYQHWKKTLLEKIN